MIQTMATPLSIRFIKAIWLALCLYLLAACTPSINEVNKTGIKATGIFVSSGEPIYQITINHNRTYQLCSVHAQNRKCIDGLYEDVPAHFGVILIDFFNSKLGQNIEEQSFGRPLSPSFIKKVRRIRQSQPRPNDLAVNLTYCGDVRCFKLGHSRDGIQFISQ